MPGLIAKHQSQREHFKQASTLPRISFGPGIFGSIKGPDMIVRQTPSKPARDRQIGTAHRATFALTYLKLTTAVLTAKDPWGTKRVSRKCGCETHRFLMSKGKEAKTYPKTRKLWKQTSQGWWSRFYALEYVGDMGQDKTVRD
jgi:hypothetical protein